MGHAHVPLFIRLINMFLKMTVSIEKQQCLKLLLISYKVVPLANSFTSKSLKVPPFHLLLS